MSIKVEEIHDFSVFVSRCVASEIRLTKVNDRTFNESGDLENGRRGMLIKKHFILTAFNKTCHTILRFESRQPIGALATNGANSDKSAKNNWFYREKRLLCNRLELEGIQVIDGEWKPEEIEQLLGIFALADKV